MTKLTIKEKAFVLAAIAAQEAKGTPQYWEAKKAFEELRTKRNYHE